MIFWKILDRAFEPKIWNFLSFEHIITFQGLHQLRAEPILLEGWVRAFLNPRQRYVNLRIVEKIYPRDPSSFSHVHFENNFVPN